MFLMLECFEFLLFKTLTLFKNATLKVHFHQSATTNVDKVYFQKKYGNGNYGYYLNQNMIIDANIIFETAGDL